MKFGDIIIALGITLAVLFLSLSMSRHDVPTTDYNTLYNGLKLTHAAAQIARGELAPARLEVKVEGGLLPDSSTLFVYLRPADSPADTAYRRAPMLTVAGEGLVYRRDLLNQGTGKKFEYFIQLMAPKDSTMADTVLATIPTAKASDPTAILSVLFEGTPPRKILIARIIVMFGALLLMLCSALSALAYPKDPGALVRAGRLAFVCVLILFVGVFLLGTKIGLVTNGHAWSGLPIGTNLSDTASATLILFWSVVVLVLRRQVFMGETAEELNGRRVQLLLIVGAALAVITALIPDGIGRL